MKKQDSSNEKNHLSTEYVSKDPRYTIDNIMEDLDSFSDPSLDWKGVDDFAVSYTHLTLPTKRIV